MQRDWNKIVKNFESSGMSVTGYAVKHNLPGSSLDYQLKKKKYGANPMRKKKARKAKANGHSPFIEVNGAAMIEITVGNATVKLPMSATAEQIRTVIKAAENE